jgi:hypothetical protein
LLAELRQPAVPLHTGLRRIARRIRPAIRIGVGESHVARTERIILAQQAQVVFNRVPAFDPDQRRDLAPLARVFDLARGARKRKIARIAR